MLEAIQDSLCRLSNHKGFRRYFANTSWMFGEQILRLVSGLLVGIWVVRYLGPEQFGIYSYALAFSALFGTVAKLGLDGVVVRNLVNEPNLRDAYLGTAFWLKLGGAFTAMVLIAVASYLSANDRATNLYVFILASGMIFQSFEVVDFFFQAKVLSKFVSLCRFVQLFISSLFKIYLVVTGKSLIWFVFATLMDQITLAITFLLAYRYQRLGTFICSFNLAVAKKMLADSWPLIFSGLVITIYMRIDQIMIKEMLGEREVGLYSAAVKLSEVWYFVPAIITTSVFPAIIAAKNISESLYVARLQRLFALTVWISIAIALPMTFLSDWIVTALYGRAYLSAGPVLTVHIWAGVFVSLGVASGRWYINENLQKHVFLRAFLGAVVNVLLNFILIPLYGMLGAAIATVAAQFMATFLFDAITAKTRPLFFQKLKSLYSPLLIVRP